MFLTILLIIIALFLLVVLLSWANADHPKDNAEIPVFCKSDSPLLARGQNLKVMTYNVQYLAGKNYVFFHDTPDLSGKATRVDRRDILSTADGIAQMIANESPDIICFQELDDGSRRTGYMDQLSLLLERLPSDYCCHTSAFYWKIRFIPHPKLFGSLGMKTAIVSKYKISKSARRNLPGLPVNFFLKQFSGKKLILQAFLPVSDGSQISVMSTHLDAFTVGSDIMTLQLNSLRSQKNELDTKHIPWILAGDFNLLPPGQFDKLTESHRSYYNPNTEIKSFYEEFRIVPALENTTGEQPEPWFTYFGNDPRLTDPDRTLDYIVYSDHLQLEESHVRQIDTKRLSDHFPVVATFEL
jgi:endonuclease/exonuclease/phosphatase family metal-dependent hydrolase